MMGGTPGGTKMMACLRCKGSRYDPDPGLLATRRFESPEWIEGQLQEPKQHEIVGSPQVSCRECNGTDEVPAEKYPFICPVCLGQDRPCDHCRGNRRVPDRLAGR